jgi:predicted Rossmann fold flavoprotein
VNSPFDVIIIGAGAAGLMCAIEAGKRGRHVIVLERNRNIGEKIRISGGGRCNFTNIITSHNNYLSDNTHFCKSALARFTPSHFISLVEKHGISYHEKKGGQLFCDASSREILTMLKEECRSADAEIHTSIDIFSLRKESEFLLKTNKGEIRSTSLVIATGGRSIPSLGATDFGYRIARQFGISCTATRPGLVPLVFNQKEKEVFGQLSGISLLCRVSCNDSEFTGNLLFTHRGLSGPAILQISSYWNPGDTISIDLLPNVDVPDLITESIHAHTDLSSALSQYLPKRFVQVWCEQHAPKKSLLHYSKSDIQSLEKILHRWNIIPDTTEGFGKAEVTCGGINTNELSSKTMESVKVPGLYFIGEVVDVTGHLGGYNFQWAWSSGYAAGQYV